MGLKCFFLTSKAMLLLLLLTGLIMQSSTAEKRRTITKDIEIISNVIEKKAEATINSSQIHLWIKNLELNMQDDLHRIRASLPHVSEFDEKMDSFIQFSASNGRDSVAFHLPERTSNGSLIYETSRFLHPLFDTHKKKNKGPQSLTITVHTQLKDNVTYELGIQGFSEGQFVIKIKNDLYLLENQKVGIGKPEAYYWSTTTLDFAQISIRSDDERCAVLYINNKEESIYYLNGEINPNPREGFRAISFSKRLDLNLGREDLRDQVFLIIILQPEDTLCGTSASPKNNFNERKTYTLTITTQAYGNYFLPLLIFIGIFLATPIVLIIYVIRQIPKSGSKSSENNPASLISFDSVQDVQQNECIQLETFQDMTLEERRRSFERTGSDSNLSYNVTILNKSYWSVGDLHFAFYLVPGLLLSGFQYFQSLDFNRIEDTCYHNYGCSRPLAGVVAFNHLMSNVGYFFNGCYYIIFVVIRHKHHYRTRGPHNNYGLEFSLGISLICQGIGSVIYHICPSRVSFSFDTPFIQITCVLAMLKLYGNRHGYVSPTKTNALIAGVIGGNVVVSICHQAFVFRLFQGVTQMVIVSIFLLKLSRNFRSNRLHSEAVKASIFAAVVIALNLLVAILHTFNIGMIQSNQVVTILCIGNMLLYLLYYYTFKIQTQEKLNWLSTTATIASLVLWFLAGYFFLQEETNWKLTAAQSRNLNSDCILLSFFDRHDIWHLLSAEAAGVSLIALSTIDDAQASFPREELAVF